MVRSDFREQFDGLITELVQRHGCVEEEDVFDPENFGNAYVLLSCNEVLVRFVRDRSQLFAEFATKDTPEAWFGFGVLLEYLHASPAGPAGPFTLAELEHLFLANFDRIRELFDETHRAENIEAIKKFRKVRSREMWAKSGVLGRIRCN